MTAEIQPDLFGGTDTIVTPPEPRHGVWMDFADCADAQPSPTLLGLLMHVYADCSILSFAAQDVLDAITTDTLDGSQQERCRAAITAANESANDFLNRRNRELDAAGPNHKMLGARS
jgi:hypothetical protein